jgi:hypothetical protein
VTRKLIIAALAGGALLWPQPAIAPISAHQSPVDTVQVEHEVIHVTPSQNRVPPAPARISRSASVRVAAARKPADRPAPQGIVSRARRALLGDGRYRPDPFPRPGR